MDKGGSGDGEWQEVGSGRGGKKGKGGGGQQQRGGGGGGDGGSRGGIARGSGPGGADGRRGGGDGGQGQSNWRGRGRGAPTPQTQQRQGHQPWPVGQQATSGGRSGLGQPPKQDIPSWPTLQQQQGSQSSLQPSQPQPGPSKAPAWGVKAPQVEGTQGVSSTGAKASPMGCGVTGQDNSSSQGAGDVLSMGTPQTHRQPQTSTTKAATVEVAMGSLTLTSGNWLPLPDSKDDIELPKRNFDLEEKMGRAFSDRKITIATNHYPLSISLPRNIFMYEVSVKREPKKEVASSSKKTQPKKPTRDPSVPVKYPKRILQKLLKCLRVYLTNEYRRKMKAGVGIASDFAKIFYSTEKLEEIGLIHTIDMSKLKEMGIEDPDPIEEEEGVFVFTLAPTDLEIDTEELGKHVNGTLGINNPKLLDLAAVYNCVIKSMPNYKYMAMGNSLLTKFPPKGEDGRQLGGGLTTWPGISACINRGWKFFLNVELGYATMVVGESVLSRLATFFNCSKEDILDRRSWTNDDIRNGSKFMETCKISYTAGGKRTKTVRGIHNKSASEESFEVDKERLTVVQYFKKRYDIKLDPNGILLSFANGTTVPAELCTIKAGQSVNRKLDDTQTTEMLKIAKKVPHQLEADINKEVSAFKENDLLQSFGVKLGPKMLEMECRVLPAPNITYRDNKSFSPKDGVWQIWRDNFRFLKPVVKIDFTINWALLNFGRNDQNATNAFINALVQCGRKCGMSFSENPLPMTRQQGDLVRGMRDDGDHEGNVSKMKTIFNAWKTSGCMLVVVVINRKPSILYAQAKQAAELKAHGVGMLTQCILSKNYSPPPCPNPRFQKTMDPNSATIQQLLLKVNTKLGGISHCVSLPPNLGKRFEKINLRELSGPVLILGADVTHPSDGFGKNDIPVPSFASVTGSMDRTCMPYMMSVQAQQKAGKGSAEVIPNLADIVENMIRIFLITSETLPHNIIYYRDGVGEGQYKEVLHVEMRGIREACSRFDKMHKGVPYEPMITFVTVQKRHKTRFFYHNNGRTENAPPGTVLDSQIVHPSEIDFYLLSHAAIQGTSRPTRYHILWDDSEFTADELQLLTFHLCHMYARCNRSVKIPAPTYYAHWAAERAKVLAHGNKFIGDLGRLNESIQRHENFVFSSKEGQSFPMHFI